MVAAFKNVKSLVSQVCSLEKKNYLLFHYTEFLLMKYMSERRQYLKYDIVRIY